ncbi:MAG: hypothetical protein JJU29_00885 [Verrucomicrobia bacterium]|nr:hypothetical protein [Verrucomicrobiota bacterium]
MPTQPDIHAVGPLLAQFRPRTLLRKQRQTMTRRNHPLGLGPADRGIGGRIDDQHIHRRIP